MPEHLSINAIRWHLARLIAPRPITALPGDGKVYILIHDEQMDAWFEADRFRMKINTKLPALGSFDEPATSGRFVGTVKA